MRPLPRARLHDQITSELALRVIRGQRDRRPVAFPNEQELCRQLGVSRTVVRESMKVLADKGMVEMRPRAGTKARPRSEWRLLDPDILSWQAELEPDAQFLRDLCEVRLAIEPTAAGFAALRSTTEDTNAIALCLARRETLTRDARLDEIIDADLQFHAAVVAASHNLLLQELSNSIRRPFRTALLYTSRFPANLALALDAQFRLLEALKVRDPLAARRATEEAVGLAMVAVEEAIRLESSNTPARRKPAGRPHKGDTPQ
ncbi:MAG TPA: FadR/GntR family transcriptional regulator [Bryobacteraceae bacterium]|nr:FadR/GntR family transcriptional regulator [Bryobacteraceae bacterium]